jgi:hypothetical protein
MRGCSHCNRNGHTKRTCPDSDISAEEAQALEARDRKTYFSATNVIAELLGKFPPEQRVWIAVEGFKRSKWEYQSHVLTPINQREDEATTLLQAEMKKWEPREEPATKRTPKPKKPALVN